jgi:tetratricopeptide (TPR) repeat protein
MHKEEERICRELGSKEGLQNTLGNQANILYARGDLDGAMTLNKEKERLCQELGNKIGLQATLGNQANILYARGDLDGAMALYKETERLGRERGYPEELPISLASQARVLRCSAEGKDEARRLVDEALAIATLHGYGRLIPNLERIRDSISSYRTTTHRSQVWAVASTPHPSANGARAQQMNLEYQTERKKWEALPWWKRIRTTEPKPPTGI